MLSAEKQTLKKKKQIGTYHLFGSVGGPAQSNQLCEIAW